MHMVALLAKRNEAELRNLARVNFSSNLTESELRVIHDSVRPGPASIGPTEQPEGRHLRADFLRWLANDANARLLFDKDGIQVAATTVDGDLDLDNSHIPCNLSFNTCVFSGRVHFAWSTVQFVYITHSTMKHDLSFENATVNGDIALQYGFQTCGSIKLYGAQVTGTLTMDGARLLNPESEMSLDNAEFRDTVYLRAVQCAGNCHMLNTRFPKGLDCTEARFGNYLQMNGARVGADVTLRCIEASRFVDLSRSNVDGDVYFDGAVLKQGPSSLTLGNAMVAGRVFLGNDLKSSRPFRASGSVSLAYAQIKGGISVFEARLPELDCTSAQIGGDFTWGRVHDAAQTKLILSRTKVNRFRDAKTSWPKEGNLKLDGLVYQEISLKVPQYDPDISDPKLGTGEINPDDRIVWLELQSDNDKSASQPWLQLAQYLESKGNAAGAKKVLYKMHRYQARMAGPVSSALSVPYDIIDENPWRILYPIGLLWLVGSLVFWRARRMGAVRPTDIDAAKSFSETGKESDGYVPFYPPIYTLENVLPVIQLGQDHAWAPNPRVKPQPREGWRRVLPQMCYGWLSLLRWLLIGLGWALAAILAGVIGSLFKS
jgi:hypothetical protein